MKYRIFLLLIAMCMVNCGIFAPKEDFEKPVYHVFVDRFNFSKLIAIPNGKNLTWESYDKMFSDSMTYSELNSSSKYTKNSFIEHLHQIEQNLYPKFSITWGTIDDSHGDGVNTKFYMTGVKYTVIYDTTENPPRTQSGTSNIVFVNDGGKYKISDWSDFPNDDEQSFWAPNAPK